jgi:hypothetical protein
VHVIISASVPERIPEHTLWGSTLHGSGTQRAVTTSAIVGGSFCQHYKMLEIIITWS